MKKFIISLIVFMMIPVSFAKADETYIDYIVTASVLNVRASGSMQAQIIGKLYNGNTIKGENSQNPWIAIEYNNGIAYVSRQWVKPVSAGTAESKTYLGRYYITGYDICYACNGNTHGITASGAKATVGRTVAVAGLPFGTQLYIDGIGYRVVEDRGCKAGIIDVLCNNHSECYAITSYRDVYVVK